MNCINVRTSKNNRHRRLVLITLAVLILNAGVALPLQAQTESAGSQPLTAITQKWTAGWDNFSEPLNYTTSKIKWSVNATTRKLSVTYTLAGARPSKLYQVGITFFCTTFPSTFGQFPNDAHGGGACGAITRQGVTKSITQVELGVVTTDIHGNGSFTVTVGPITAGTYDVEFMARDGAGCFLTGGAGNGSDCAGDFQSPGPTFGDVTSITIP
jgi:hypothetical protein